MRGATKELLESSNLDGEQLQIAIRVAHNNLKDKRRNFDEFVNEGAHSRIIQYSYLHLLFAQVIVMVLSEESKQRQQKDTMFGRIESSRVPSSVRRTATGRGCFGRSPGRRRDPNKSNWLVSLDPHIGRSRPSSPSADRSWTLSFRPTAASTAPRATFTSILGGRFRAPSSPMPIPTMRASARKFTSAIATRPRFCASASATSRSRPRLTAKS